MITSRIKLSPNDCSLSSEKIQLLGQIVSIVTVVVGWIVVHKLTEKRDKRKEIRESIDAFIDLLLDLEKKAIDFHQNTSFNENTSRELVSDIQRCILRLDSYPLCSIEIDGYLKKDLRTSITLNNFDRSTFHQLSPSDPIVREISCGIDSLSQKIKEEFKNKYC